MLDRIEAVSFDPTRPWFRAQSCRYSVTFFGALTEQAEELGLVPNVSDGAVLEFMRDTDAALRTLYLKVGAPRGASGSALRFLKP